MNDLTTAGGQAATMTSDELLDLINQARAEFGQAPIRRNKLAEKIEDELAGEHYTKRVVRNSNSTESAVFDLTRDQCLLISMRESKGVRRRVVAKLKALASPAMAIPQTRAQALRLAADLEEQNAALALENQQLTERNEHLESLFTPGMTPVDFCKKLNGVNTSQVSHWLMTRNWLYNEADPEHRPRWRVKSYARDRYLTEKIGKEIQTSKHSFIPHTAQLLQAGAVRLYELYLRGELPMKARWNGEFTHSKFPKESLQ